jgi:hypothetical protein
MYPLRFPLVPCLIALAACGSQSDSASARPSSAAGPSATTTSATTGSTIGVGGAGPMGGGGTGGGSISVPDAGSGTAGDAGTGACTSGPAEDRDKDGYTAADGDCNDCDPNTNPGAFDVPDNKIDEDCTGTPDDEPRACDDPLPVDGDAVAAAKAIGICRTAVPGATGKNRTWGLLSARYVMPNGSATGDPYPRASSCVSPGGPPADLSHGILKDFGPNVKPRQGTALAALSSGIARAGRNQLPASIWPEFPVFSPGGVPMCTASTTPDGFPASSYTTCGDLFGGGAPRDKTLLDGIALELVVRVPTNAKSFSFDFDFYTYEYTTWICSPFNDTFVALLYSKSPDVPPNHNIAFDAQKNPVSVNNGFVEVCEPYTYEGVKGGAPFTRMFTCQYGTRELEGTGFDKASDRVMQNHAATGWLQTRANIVPGEEMTLRFAIWDTADFQWDSTVLLDNVTWAAMPGETMTVRPPPPPPPK